MKRPARTVMAARPTSPSKPSPRAALDILRGRSRRRRRRKPTAAELANERRVFYELAELMEAGVLVDRTVRRSSACRGEDDRARTPQASLAEQLSLDHLEWQACSACTWAWSLSCWRSGCWEAERTRT